MGGILGEERVLVIGAGALGSVYGGMLGLAGFDVQLFAREPHARAITQAGGVRILRGEEALLAPVRAEWRPDRIEPAEIAVLLTKTVDTGTALDPLRHLIDDLNVAISLQNGVEKDHELAAWCGADRVVGAMSVVGGTSIDPGTVRFSFPGPTFLGELPEGTSPRVERLGEIFRAGGFEIEVTPRILSAEWSKLVHAVPVMSIAALTRLPYHQLLLDPELAAVFLQLIREGTAVAGAAGVELDDWPMLMPLRTMRELPDADALEIVHALGRRLTEQGATQVLISMLQSVQTERRLEVEAVQGYLLREGRRLGVSTPALETCYRLIKGIDTSFA
jgi:2-dehydropantoate 2-reductase